MFTVAPPVNSMMPQRGVHYVCHASRQRHGQLRCAPKQPKGAAGYSVSWTNWFGSVDLLLAQLLYDLSKQRLS
jgi:hypothetical protein